MKYISIDRLSDFEFHDTTFDLQSSEGNSLTVMAKHLNIHTSAEQNPFENDMEIETACIRFERIDVVSYKTGGAKRFDANGNYIDIEPEFIFDKQEAHGHFIDQLKSGITVLYLGEDEKQRYIIEAVGHDSFFMVAFSFDRMIIEWDDYIGEAWYASRKK